MIKINYPAAEQRSIKWNIEKRPKGRGINPRPPQAD